MRDRQNAMMLRTVALAMLALTIPSQLPGCAGSSRSRTAIDVPDQTARSARDQNDERQVAGSSKPGKSSKAAKTRARDEKYDISLAQIRAHQQAGTAVLIDARGPDQFSRGHLEGAINLPASMMNAYVANVLQRVSSQQLVVIYCNSRFCEASNIVYDYLRRQGYENMRIYKPGWAVLSLANVKRSNSLQ